MTTNSSSPFTGKLSGVTLVWLGCLLITITLMIGCGSNTETARENRRLLDAILTAITMKNVRWLEDDAQLADKRHSEHQLTDWEYEQLTSILEKAKSGDWATAEKLGYEFRKIHPFIKPGQ